MDPAVVDVETLAAVPKDHVVRGAFSADALTAPGLTRGTLRGAGGLERRFRLLAVDGEWILAGDVPASSGIVRASDGVPIESDD